MKRQKEKLSLFADKWANVYMDSQPTIFASSPVYQRGFQPEISRRPANNIVVFNLVGKAIGVDNFSQYRFSMRELVRIVCLLWRQTAVIRYTELWGAFTTEKFVRGMLGTARLETWIERVVRGHAERQDFIQVLPRPEKKWLPDIRGAFPHINRWSEHAIQSAQRYARKQTRARYIQR